MLTLFVAVRCRKCTLWPVKFDPVTRGHLIDLAIDCVLRHSFSLWSDRRNRVFVAIVLILLDKEYMQLLCCFWASLHVLQFWYSIMPTAQSIVCSWEEAQQNVQWLLFLMCRGDQSTVAASCLMETWQQFIFLVNLIWLAKYLFVDMFVCSVFSDHVTHSIRNLHMCWHVFPFCDECFVLLYVSILCTPRLKIVLFSVASFLEHGGPSVL